MPIGIYDKATNRRLFEITEAQLDELTDVLEEEDEHQHDYYVDAAVCDFLDGRIDAAVVGKLRAAVGASAPPSSPGVRADEAEAAGDDDEPPPPIEEDEDQEGEGDGLEIVWRKE